MIGYKSGNSAQKFFLFGIILISLIGFIILASALTSDEKTALQAELDNLTSFLNDNNYGWLAHSKLNYLGKNF